ncbi:hypothetical protein FSP39_011429 [Pinctada imbricata]|uniref:Homeobox domain-containing protein n=1 Tax=Pinctada imbricata TaxID=66713 RepID=A0AA88YD00_PINIB|nr:hypothetical protein FSP39_011429 [Pinctada imbricata]
MGMDSDLCSSTTGGRNKNRIKYTTQQLELLDSVFATQQYPDSATLDDLSDKLNVTIDKVSIWFQNRRSKFKRQSRDNHVAWMRRQFYGTEHAQNSTSCSVSGKPHVLSPPVPKREPSSDAVQKPSSNLHYMPQIPPFLESLLDLSSSSSSSSSPPSSNVTSPNTSLTGSSPESPPFPHRAFPTNPWQSSHHFNVSGSPYSLPSCDFYSVPFSNVQYPSQPQFPMPYQPDRSYL